MEFNFLPATSPLIMLLITISYYQSRTSVFAQEEQYLSCSKPLQCGNITEIGYPFWGFSRPRYCGHPDFELKCTPQNATIITISELTFQVLNINNASQILTLARTDYISDICPKYLHNTTINPNFFSYTPDTQNGTLFYGCNSSIPSKYDPIIGMTCTIYVTESAGSGSEAQGQANSSRCSSLTPSEYTSLIGITCSINGTESPGYFLTSSLTSYEAAAASNISSVYGTCNDKVIVPANKTVVDSSLVNSSDPTQADLVAVLDQGFGLKWDADNTDAICTKCKRSGGACGYDSTSSSFVCYCSDRAYTSQCNGTLYTPPSHSTSGNSSNRIPLAIGSSIGATASACISLGCLYWIIARRKELFHGNKFFGHQKKEPNDRIELFLTNYHSLMPKRFSYSGIKKMTNSFSEKLGQGGFGCVYKGKLPDGRPVAVKVLTDSEGNDEEFINEVASIGITSHVNIVALLGYCFENGKRALIYQYMPNGSLDKFIFRQGSVQIMECRLEWKTLYDISVGIARGLEYLHRGCDTRIVHLDIKPQNILLDEDFHPKISDFGLAKLFRGKESKLSMLGPRGTVGYIAPEVFSRSFGQVSHKSDVYSYGMMLLEIVGGRKNFDNGLSHTSKKDFPLWIYTHLNQVDASSLGMDATKEEEEIARKMILVGLCCIQTSPLDRPSMTNVVEMLEGSHQNLQIPPKPILYSPDRSPPRHSSVTPKLSHSGSLGGNNGSL